MKNRFFYAVAVVGLVAFGASSSIAQSLDDGDKTECSISTKTCHTISYPGTIIPDVKVPGTKIEKKEDELL